jgi:DNA-binding NtrC family response regulator
MPTVLVVEDDESNRIMIARALARAGHDVIQAASGEEAIAAGLRRRPAVLVADWMLRNRLHGLHVTRTLQLVDAGIQTILMTGYPSQDLLDAAEGCGSCEVLAKPFRLAAFHAAVERAMAAARPDSGEPCGHAVGILEVDGRGHISFENPAASAMLGRVRRAGDLPSLHRLFHRRDVAALADTTERWLELSPIRNQALRWAIRARAWPDSLQRHLVLCSASDHDSRSDPRVAMLLGSGNAAYPRWPFEGRVLVVGARPGARFRFVAALERAGGTGYAASSLSQATRLLATDPGIAYVLVNCEKPGGEARETIGAIRLARPDVEILGSSGIGVHDELKSLGVDHTIARPWLIESLIRTLRDGAGKPRNRTPHSARPKDEPINRARDLRTEPPPSSPRRVRI